MNIISKVSTVLLFVLVTSFTFASNKSNSDVQDKTYNQSQLGDGYNADVTVNTYFYNLTDADIDLTPTFSGNDYTTSNCNAKKVSLSLYHNDNQFAKTMLEATFTRQTSKDSLTGASCSYKVDVEGVTVGTVSVQASSSGSKVYYQCELKGQDGKNYYLSLDDYQLHASAQGTCRFFVFPVL